jgi:Protein of unknown function C-terminus (DUF2399)
MTLNDALQGALAESLKSVSKDWTTLKRQADRNQRLSTQQIARFRERPHMVTVKEAAYACMREAYLKVSGPRRLPANARQIMYAARRRIAQLTGKSADKLWSNDAYFTQQLLPNYVNEHPGVCADWDVTFDARGHFTEPHTGAQFGLGTLDVRGYVRNWHAANTGTPDLDDILSNLSQLKTSGPTDRYSAVLFIEKEGFTELLNAVNLADRYDLGIMSTKGMSVTAARQLVERLSGDGIPIYVVHDFDKSGFSIMHTLRSNTRRFTFRDKPIVHDLGLRLADVQSMDLESEEVQYSSHVDPRVNLKQSGATSEECNFLVTHQGYGWYGQRVELNAMTSDQFVEWLESKLDAAGVKKLVPDKATLDAAYRRARHIAVMRQELDQLVKNTNGEVSAVPKDLATLVAERIQGTAQPWDEAVCDLAAEAEP